MIISRTKQFFYFLSVLFLLTGTLKAQQLKHSLNFEKGLTAGTRTLSGEPGKKYWQNTADYVLDVNFNPLTLKLTGKALITYRNFSPDTLRKIVLHIYPDFYKRDALRDYYISDKDEGEGMIIDSLVLGNKVIAGENLERLHTLLKVRSKVLPGDSARMEIFYHYTLNRESHVRTGAVDSSSFFLAYFYPRIAVYDDLEGWDEQPYLGTLEPYMDFCNFTLNVTVPAKFMVWSTGELQNAAEVLSDNIYKKYRSAWQNNEDTEIISSDDIRQQQVTRGKLSNTFTFIAANVPDMAFGISDHYKWKAYSIPAKDNKHRILAGAAYNEAHRDFESVPYYTRKSLQFMADSFPAVEYPYPVLTIFDGLDQMEFPMIINDNPLEDRVEAIELTVHEIYHTLLPFYTGCNQTRNAWMDEGWATLSEWLVSPMIDSSIYNLFGRPRLERMTGQEWEVPLIFSSTEWHRSYSANAYSKPAHAFFYLREMLGKEMFNKCMQHFISNWKGKHPSQWDLFYSFNTASGKDLNWFWKAWFYEMGAMDVALVSAVKSSSGMEIKAQLKGNKPVPLYIQMFKGEKLLRTEFFSPEIWKDRANVTLKIKNTGDCDRISISHPRVPDANEKDNTIPVTSR